MVKKVTEQSWSGFQDDRHQDWATPVFWTFIYLLDGWLVLRLFNYNSLTTEFMWRLIRCEDNCEWWKRTYFGIYLEGLRKNIGVLWDCFTFYVTTEFDFLLLWTNSYRFM
jgi:hypothetical protein